MSGIFIVFFLVEVSEWCHPKRVSPFWVCWKMIRPFAREFHRWDFRCTLSHIGTAKQPTKESHMLKEIEGSSADVYKTLNAWIADFPVAPGFFLVQNPSKQLFFEGFCVVPQWDENWDSWQIHCGYFASYLHTICSETKFAHFFLVQDWKIYWTFWENNLAVNWIDA